MVDTGGDLPALVFVHGLGGRWQNWLLNIPAFMDSYRVIAPDLPGFGSSQMPAEDISIRGYARDPGRAARGAGRRVRRRRRQLDGRLRGRRAHAVVLDPGPAAGAGQRRRPVDREPQAPAAADGRAAVGGGHELGGRAQRIGDHAAAGAAGRAADGRALPGAPLPRPRLRAGAGHRRAGLHPGAGGAARPLLPRAAGEDRGAGAGRVGPQRHARPARRCARVRRADRRQRAARDVRGHRASVDARAARSVQRAAGGLPGRGAGPVSA